MRSVLKQLIQLQEVTTKIYRLEKKKKRIPMHLEEDKQVLKQVLDAIAEKQNALKVVEESIKKNQTRIEKLKDEINQLRTKEKMIKTQKEFEALDAEQSIRNDEIEQLAKRIKEEEQTLKILKDEKDQNEFNTMEKQEEIANEEKEVEEQLKGVNAQLASEYKKQKELTPSIDKQILAQYESIAKKYDGLAIVPVVDNICQGCYLAIPPHQLNEIRKNEKIVFCQNCYRIIYIPAK